MGKYQPFTIPTLFTLVTLTAAVSAFASERDVTPMSNRREILASKGYEVRIEGGLSCRIQQDSKGDHCVLRIEDFHTGKFFRLVDETAALEMYQKGMKTVAVVGTIKDSDTIQVQTIESL